MSTRTGTDHVRGRRGTIIDIARRHAEDTPSRPAYLFLADGVTESASHDFAGVDRRARAIAAELTARGLRGERVLIAYPSGMAYVESFLGCLYAGAVAVPCDSGRGTAGAERLAAIRADAEPVLALRDPAGGSGQLTGLPALHVADVPDSAAGHWRHPGVGQDEVAFLQYTSGSTRTPSGVRVTHANVLANEHAIQVACGNDRDSHFVGWLPLFHDMGLIANVLQPLYLGSRSVLMPPEAFVRSPLAWLRAVERYRARVSGGPNFAYELCLSRIGERDRAGLDLSGWTVAYNGAEPVRHETLRRFTEGFRSAGFAPTAHFPCYGLAEATLIVTSTPTAEPPTTLRADPAALRAGKLTGVAEDEPGATLVSCGPAVPGTEVEIVDPVTRSPVPAGGIGEVWLRGDGVAAGYWNRPAETEETFAAHLAGTRDRPYLRTGDLGALVENRLYITGRRKDVIVIRGENHLPQDLEHTAERAAPALRPSCGAAIAVDVDGVESVVLCHELISPQEEHDLDAIATRVRRAVAGAHGVECRHVVFVAKGGIPKTTSGKVRRQLCRLLYLNGELPVLRVVSASRAAAPDLPDLAEIAALDPEARREELAAALGRTAAALASDAETAPGADEPLARFGLDSLGAVELRHLVQRRYGVDLGATALADQASPDDLATLILSADNRKSPAAPEIEGASPDHGPLPLTEGQRALWFEHELDPAGAAYTLSRVLRIEGPLDPDVLSRALDALVARHPALRTSFPVDQDGPRRLVSPTGPHLQSVDASADADAELTARLLELAERPFDLSSAPPFAATLVRRDERTHLLVLVAHHLVMDLWSFLVVLDELRASCEARSTPVPTTSTGRRDPHETALAETADYLRSPAHDRDRDFWRRALAQAPSALELPADRPRPQHRDFRGATEGFRLPAELVRDLRAFARQRSCTLFTVLLTAYRALLHRYTGQSDLVLGTLLAGRDTADLADAVGYFIRTVPLRSRCGREDSFDALLADSGRLLRDAVDHGRYPLRHMVAELSPDRDAGRPTLVQTQFVLQQEYGERRGGTFGLAQGSEDRVGLGTATITPVELPRRWSQLDLSLSMAQLGDGLTGCWEYRTGLFDRATVAGMSGHLVELLRALVHDPARLVDAIPLRDAGEVPEAGPERDRPDLGGLHRVAAEAARAHPDTTAVVAPDGTLSHVALHRAATGVAAGLRALGALPGEPVAVLHQRGVALPIAYLGVLHAGCAVLPLDPDDPAPRRAVLLADSGTRFLLTGDDVPDDGVDLPVRRLDTAALARRPGRGRSTPVHPEQPAYLLYTSGSTGVPKGVLVPHRGIVNRLRWMQEHYGLAPGERVLHKTPVSFDVSWWELCWPLIAGGTVVLAPPGLHRDPSGLAAFITRVAVGTAHFVPSALTPFLAESARAGAAASPLRRVLCSGETLPSTTRDRFFQLFDAELHNLYGPTEASVDVTAWRCSPSEDGPVPIGLPISNTSVAVLDHRLRPVPRPIEGELFLGGVGLATCYAADPAKTAAAFVPDPGGTGARLYRTGDRARRRPDGALVFRGRADQQVKIGGQRVELGEVAEVLRAQPGVTDAAAVVRDARLIGYVRGPDAPAPAELRERLRLLVPARLVPARIVPVDVLPVTRSGKLDHHALPDPGTDPETGPERWTTRARTPSERALADLWATYLGRPAIDVDTDFFSLGGDSILAIAVSSAAREAGAGFTVAELMAHPTVASLAAHLDDRPDARDVEAEALAPFALRPELAGRGGLADAYPVSMAQRALIAHEGDNPAYEVYATSVVVSAALEPSALAQAVRLVLARHPYLRSSFDLTGSAEPMQLVWHDVPRLPLEVLDLSGDPAPEERFSAWLEAERKRHFDLDHGPLARFTAHDLGPVFRLTTSSFGLDGWCTALVLTEVLHAYREASRGATWSPPPLRTGYADFVALERSAISSPEDRAFWAAELRGARPSTLPRWATGSTTRQPTLQQRTVLEVDDHVRDALSALGVELGVGLKHVLLGVHLRVVSAATGAEDAVTGLETNGRPERRDGDRVVGVFNNILPLRVGVPGDASWADLARAAYAAERRTSPHRRYPLITLNREFGAGALFDVLFVFTHFHLYRELSAAGGPGISGLQAPDQTYVPLTAHFNVDAESGRLRLLLEADPAKVPAEQVEEFGGLFAAALRAAARRPHEAASRWAGSVGASGDHASVPEPGREPAVHELVEAAVHGGPDRIALVEDGKHLSYRGLWAASARLAEALQAFPVGPDTVVGLWAERGVDYVVGLLAILRAGAAHLSIDPETPQERVAAVLADARATLLVLPRGVPAPEGVAFGAVLRTSAAPGPGSAGGVRRPRLSGSNLACVLATSGSTGRPKLVGVHHYGLVNYLRWCVSAYGITEGTSAPVHSSPAFDLTVTSLLAPLTAGGVAHLLPGADVTNLGTALLSGRHTLVKITPSHLFAVAGHLAARGRALGGLTVVVGGERLDGGQVAAARAVMPDALLFNEYGPTETVVGCSAHRVGAVVEGPVPIGEPITGASAAVLDARDGHRGELAVGGVGVTRGYLGLPGATALAFAPDPERPGARRYRTGDLVQRLPGGALVFRGRADRQVKLRGHRVDLGEIEQALTAHPAVTGAAVLLGNGAAGSARLIAYWSGTSQPSELRDWLRRRLPARLVPGDLRWLAALPLTGSGKVDHAALAARPEHRERLVDRIELLTDEEAAWLLRMARGQADRPQEPGGRDDRA
ncbi:non-ribosomal peptide synthetase [Actinosynnema mirum]|uniref:Amino acid adenylation domain protein n=1 Tax=Actinosynnema mirum (strain ATCC 29888 / DSM 43827 / JCM 3225 / NBRC 14064 / NCIMB 13271 / NRRL B-12336 / IMRU 3971 / 101) TaxID=446462 RepID=C6WBZ7_ACTMD|nr:non-ribosomal peptide synthetase [Actinosynnema mirum]ACU37564.1 amino acid adenylation domain protein [Actinosynnema mirum DSM 43827]